MEEKEQPKEDDKKKGAVPKKPLREIIKEKRGAFKKASKEEKAKMDEPVVKDPYKLTNDFKDKFRKRTAYGCVISKQHKSPWDERHPENPGRVEAIHEALQREVLSRMEVIEYDKFVNLEAAKLLAYAHSPDYIKNVRDLCEHSDPDECRLYDSIYYNTEESFKCAVDAARMAVSISKLVAEGKYQNGFANIRPPGHHATADVPNGYCLFNNVAIAANYLLQTKLAERILIVDYDVHHGQGTQQMFYRSKEVLYFSIHRYENGLFWPNLAESNFDYIGVDEGIGHNINVPLNETGIGDYDYLAIIINVLLPIAYEFQPSIILLSGGYDACLGDPEGRMNVTPAFYGHLIQLLSGLAEGKLVVLLEGGYFIPSLVEAAIRTCRALLNDPCSKLEYSKHINPSVHFSISDVKTALRPHWRCFYQLDHVLHVGELYKFDKFRVQLSVREYIGTPEKAPYPLVGAYPLNKPKQEAVFVAQLEYMKDERYINKLTKVGYIFNHESIYHQPPTGQRVQEVHSRVIDIMKKLKDFGLTEQMTEVDFETTKEDPYHPVFWDEVWQMMVATHSASYIYELGAQKEDDRNDIYWNEQSRGVCQWSVAILCQLGKKIRRGIIRHGVAIIRPPGHHAKYAEGGGFCLVNNVVVAANYLIRKEAYKKVLIVDFDVHHGDGTQELTYQRSDIMYISMHRYDGGKFFPKEQLGCYQRVGEGLGVGYNINIPFNDEKMENADYLHTFIKIVLPLSYTFNPDIILVSAGFDAAINDPLGNYGVFPEVYGHFIQLLKPIAPLILALEGGYHAESTSLGMVNCVRALLGHPLPGIVLGYSKDSTLKTITNVITYAKQHWPIMEVNKMVEQKKEPKKPGEHEMKSVKSFRIHEFI